MFYVPPCKESTPNISRLSGGLRPRSISCSQLVDRSKKKLTLCRSANTLVEYTFDSHLAKFVTVNVRAYLNFTSAAVNGSRTIVKLYPVWQYSVIWSDWCSGSISFAHTKTWSGLQILQHCNKA